MQGKRTGIDGWGGNGAGGCDRPPVEGSGCSLSPQGK